jgi:prepilin-type N-terminal cleavage/methylation domain-containing protein
VTIMAVPLRGNNPVPARARAFTLVELLVVIVILSILGSLSLAGLNVGRQRAKKDRTASTIRKLSDIVEEMYDDYATRSCDDAKLTELMAYEMPDQWADVRAESEWTTLDSAFKTAATRRFSRLVPDSARRTQLGEKLTNAECLWLCVARSGFQPDALEQFRPDELTDLDNDGAKEFADGWGKPIFFLRWAPGYKEPLSALQTDAIIEQAKNSRPGTAGSGPKSWRTVVGLLTPLVYSAGPDEATNDTLSGPDGYGLERPSGLRKKQNLPVDPFDPDNVGAPKTGISDPNAYRDNITNHDLMAR